MSGTSGLTDVLNVILERGIVVDAWVRVSTSGIEDVTIRGRVVIASVDTHLRYAAAIGLTALAAAPRLAEPTNLPGGRTGRSAMPAFGGPTEKEIFAHLEAHQAILNRLVQEDVAVLDPERMVYRPAGILAPAIP